MTITIHCCGILLFINDIRVYLMHSHLHIPLVFFRVNEQARLVHPLDKRNSCQLQMDESFYDSVYQIGEIVGIFTDQVTGMTIVGNVLQI